MDIYNSTGGEFDLICEYLSTVVPAFSLPNRSPKLLPYLIRFIIAWDPRGIAFSSAFISCFDDTEDSSFGIDSWIANLTTLGGLQAPASGPSQKDIDTFLANVNAWSGLVDTFTSECNQKNAAHLTQVGTVATVQDMVAIADAITGPGNPINYYGYS